MGGVQKGQNIDYVIYGWSFRGNARLFFMAYGSQVSTENNGLEFEEPVRDKCKKYCLGSISDVVREIWWSINNSHYCTPMLLKARCRLLS